MGLEGGERDLGPLFEGAVVVYVEGGRAEGPGCAAEGDERPEEENGDRFGVLGARCDGGEQRRGGSMTSVDDVGVELLGEVLEAAAVVLEDADEVAFAVEFVEEPPAEAEEDGAQQRWVDLCRVSEVEFADAGGAGGDVVEVGLDGFVKQCVFAGEVLVEAAAARLEPGGDLDVADGGGVEAAFGEKSHPFGEETLAGRPSVCHALVILRLPGE